MDEIRYIEVRRDKDSCLMCLRCDKIIYGFSNMNRIKIRDTDFKKEDVQKSVEFLISICPSESIDLFY